MKFSPRKLAMRVLKTKRGVNDELVDQIAQVIAEAYRDGIRDSIRIAENTGYWSAGQEIEFHLLFEEKEDL